jgi:hypothetical protein
MPSSLISTLRLPLTVNGTATGYITVASTTGVIVGSRGYVGSSSIGSITAATGANTTDQETITINDGTTELILEFDDNAALVTVAGPGQTVVGITFTGAETADQMRDLVIAAINGVSAVKYTASNGGAGVVTLTAKNPGAFTYTITEATVNWTKTNITGGADTLTVEVMEVTATTLGLKSVGSDGEDYTNYGRSSMSAFLTANNAFFQQNAQLVTDRGR